MESGVVVATTKTDNRLSYLFEKVSLLESLFCELNKANVDRVYNMAWF